MSLLSNCKKDKEECKSPLDEEPNWKVVGSHSRRGSVAQQEHTREESNPLEKQWVSFGGFQWEGPKDQPITNTSRFVSLPLNDTEAYFEQTSDPLFRHQRSLSFSIGQDPTFFGYDDYSTRNNSLLAPTLEEDENEQQHPGSMNFMSSNRLHHSMDDAYFRSRSQSISSAFGLYSPSSVATTNSSSSSYWMNRHAFIHPTSPTFILPPHVEEERHCFTDYFFPETIPNGPPNQYSSSHFISNPSSMHQLTDMVEKTHLQSSSMLAVVDSLPEGVPAGKGISLLKLPSHVLLYMVEFKSGRTDFYYVSDTFMQLHIGDSVLVEADRGKDLGKIATDTLTINQVVLLKQQQQTSNSNRLILDEECCHHDKKKDTFVKKIYRKALPDEISLLFMKDQDEQKALTLCLQKIKNRKLQMEVVDAEFQWDRQKLTFYFIAEKRIDFRELVRELFKIYKTRIWMCTVNPTIPIKSVTSSNYISFL